MLKMVIISDREVSKCFRREDDHFVEIPISEFRVTVEGFTHALYGKPKINTADVTTFIQTYRTVWMDNGYAMEEIERSADLAALQAKYPDAKYLPDSQAGRSTRHEIGYGLLADNLAPNDYATWYDIPEAEMLNVKIRRYRPFDWNSAKRIRPPDGNEGSK